MQTFDVARELDREFCARVLLQRLPGPYGLRSTTAQRAVSLAMWFASIQ